LFWQVFPVDAQFFPGQGGFGGGGNRSRGTSQQRTYSSSGTVGDAVISFDPETRRLIVISDEETGQYISQVVSNLDTPKPQVLIKVVFIEVEHNDGSDIGLEGTYNGNFGNSFQTGTMTNYGVVNNQVVPTSIDPVFGRNMAALTNAFGLQSSPFSPSGGLYQLFTQDYTVTLRAIAQAGKAKILSRPSIVARNNQPATINVGQDVPLITDVRYDNFGNAINSVRYESVGIILKVTPFITSDNLVELIVSPETSDLVADRSQWVPISSGVGVDVRAPIINTRSADTVVVTPNGQTVVIGGLMFNSDATMVSKIPYLGDIPLIGALFRRTIKNSRQTELLIFLTPYIVQAPTELAAVSKKEEAKFDGPKTLTEKELNRFLDRLPEKEKEDQKAKDKSKNGKSKPKTKTEPGTFSDVPVDPAK
jgi:general secretion pathway protein D